MNYQKVYNAIIEKAKSENRKKNEITYYENHHIIPKCLGGLNNKENLVLLSAREHFICHKLLTYIYPDKGIYFAFHALCYNINRNKKRNYIVSSRDYEYCKLMILKYCSGKNHPMYGKTHSDLTIKKQSECKKGDKNPMFGKNNTHDENWSNKISKSLLNSKKLKDSRSSLEYKQKLSNVQSNKTLVLDTNHNIKYSFKNCKEVAKFFNLTYGNIKNARRDKRLIGKSMNEKFYIIYEKDF